MPTKVKEQARVASPASAKYPRPGWYRAFRTFFRFFWLVIILASIGALVPSIVAAVNQHGAAWLEDPTNLASVVHLNQIQSLWSSNQQLVLEVGGAAGVIFLASIVAAILSTGDVRRERRALRSATGSSKAASSGAAPGSITLDQSIPAPSSEPYYAEPYHAEPYQSEPYQAQAYQSEPYQAEPSPAPNAGAAWQYSAPTPAVPSDPPVAQPAADPPSYAWLQAPQAPQPPPAPAVAPVQNNAFAAPYWQAPPQPSAPAPQAGAANIPAAAGQSALDKGRAALQRVRASAAPMVTNAMQRTKAYFEQDNLPTAAPDPVIDPTPIAQRTPKWQVANQITEGQLGARIDGWADTVVGMSDHATAMVEYFVADLPSHFRSTVNAISMSLGVTGLSTAARGVDLPFSPKGFIALLGTIRSAFVALPKVWPALFGVKIVGKRRPYLFAVTTPGAVMGVNISASGQDLYIAWDLFFRRVWNEVAIGLTFLGAIAIGAIAALFSLRFGLGAAIGAFIVTGFFAFLWIWGISLVVGFLTRSNPFAPFLKQIDLFEEHDIQTMMLATHKALLAAADKAGVDVKLLRAKTEFRSGQRNRVI